MLALQAVQIIHMDGFEVTEQHDKNSQTDSRLGSSNRQNEEDEDLPRKILKIVREGNEVHIHREQHQLDGHQDNDQILPVKENPDDANGKQNGAEYQKM